MCNSWGHFYWHGLNVITAWISNYVHYTVWVKLRIHYQTTRVQLLKFVIGSIFHQRLYWTCDYLSMLGLKLVHVSKWASGYIVMHHFAFKYTCIAENLITLETLSSSFALYHDDVIKWKHFPRNWPFVREIHRSPVNFPHKGQWRGCLLFSLIYARKNDWVNNREAGDLRRQHGHYDVIVMEGNPRSPLDSP